MVFSPMLDRHRITLSTSALGARPSLTARAWDRAVEASWACQLDAVLDVLSAISQTTAGSVLLGEQRVFVFLAHCPLLQAAVLPLDGASQFPAAYAWPQDRVNSGMLRGRAWMGPWRRPLHTSWCRALLLVAALLASAPQLGPEALVFLETYAPRLQYVFCKGLQSKHLAILEEAAAACRVVAVLAHQGIAAPLLVDAAMQASSFIVNACLSERSAPSELFLPVATLEKIGAGVATDGEVSPAAVPSVFHQRIEYLALDFLKSFLVGMLRLASSPAQMAGGFGLRSGFAQARTAAVAGTGQHGGSWPMPIPSVLGLPTPGSLAFGPAEAGRSWHERCWASVMDVVMEGCRRVLEIMEALLNPRQAPLLLVSSVSSTGSSRDGRSESDFLADPLMGNLLLPLSLALAALEPSGSSLEADQAAAMSSPGHLARGLSPPKTPASPSHFLSPPASPHRGSHSARTGGKAERSRLGITYKHMVWRARSMVGGQLAQGLTPEYVSVSDLRRLCASMLEMSCTLLFQYCQVTQCGGFVAGEQRAAPGAAVLNGLLGLLHELRSSEALLGIPGIDAEFLTALDAALRLGQGPGAAEAELQLSNPALDGELWVPPQAISAST